MYETEHELQRVKVSTFKYRVKHLKQWTENQRGEVVNGHRAPRGSTGTELDGLDGLDGVLL